MKIGNLQELRNLIISAIVGQLPLNVKCRMQGKTTQSAVTKYKQLPKSGNSTICTMPSLLELRPDAPEQLEPLQYEAPPSPA